MLAPLSRGPGTWSGRYHRAAVVLVAGAPFVFLAAFALEPLVQQGVGSFFNWYDLKPNTFAGLRDYRDVFADSIARGALLHTLVYVAITVPLEVGLGFFGAWMVLRVRRGRAVLMALYVLPLVIPWEPAANLFLGFFNYGGVLDGIRAHLFGAHHAVLWFQDPRLAFAVIVLMGAWKGAPWCFLLMFAALSASRADLFEAGRMDGARVVCRIGFTWSSRLCGRCWCSLQCSAPSSRRKRMHRLRW